MNRAWKVGTALGAGIALSMSLTAAAAASSRMEAWLNGSGRDISPFVEVTLEDATFGGPNCLEVPVTANMYGGGSVYLTATHNDSSLSTSEYLYTSKIVDNTGPVPKPVLLTGGFLVCPYVDGAGEYSVKGEFASGREKAALSDGSFSVSKAAASQQSVYALQEGRGITVTGAIVADIGARLPYPVSTRVTVRVMLSKDKRGIEKWRSLGSVYSDENGDFTLSATTDKNLRGRPLTVTSRGSAWVTGTAAETKIS